LLVLLPLIQYRFQRAAGDADRAEELLLGSCRPAAAIEAATRAGRWERALELAETLEPHAVGGLALLRAQALEAEGQVGGSVWVGGWGGGGQVCVWGRGWHAQRA
jgi:hypothetical protein